jgi:hypothetical protein
MSIFSIPPQHPDPDDFDSNDDFAEEVAIVAIEDAARPEFKWAIGGSTPGESQTETEYAIEPLRGSSATGCTDELYGAVEVLSEFCLGARIIKRQITYGPWEYVTPEEIVNGSST